MLSAATTTSRIRYAFIVALGLAQAACAEHASRPVPSPQPEDDGGSEPQDAAAPLDANRDLFHPPDAGAADDAAMACPSGQPSLVALNLQAPVEAAIDACNSQLLLRNCQGEVCEHVISNCGGRTLRFDAAGCAIEFSASLTPDALAGEAAACVLAKLAGTCEPCAADLEVNEYSSCTI